MDTWKRISSFINSLDGLCDNLKKEHVVKQKTVYLLSAHAQIAMDICIIHTVINDSPQTAVANAKPSSMFSERIK